MSLTLDQNKEPSVRAALYPPTTSSPSRGLSSEFDPASSDHDFEPEALRERLRVERNKVRDYENRIETVRLKVERHKLGELMNRRMSCELSVHVACAMLSCFLTPVSRESTAAQMFLLPKPSVTPH